MSRTTGKVNLSLLMPVLLVGGGFFLLKELRTMFKGAGDVAKTGIEKGKEAGEAISKVIAASTLPDFDSRPTIIDVTQGAQSKCPSGYKLTYGSARGWYCLKTVN